MMLLGVWINYRLAKPIDRVATHVKNLGNHIHLPALPMNLAQSKELATLVTGVNQTAQQIQSQMDLLKQQSERIEEQAQKLQLTNYLLEQKVKERTEKLQLLSITDPMTGLYNRRHFNEQITSLWDTACHARRCLALLMLDVDYFKRYNDSMGHHAGDTALIAVADILKTSAAETRQLAFRLGGEEMAMLLIVDHPEMAQQQAQDVNQRLIDRAIPHPNSDAAPVLTASIGVCYVDARHCPRIALDADRLYLLADEALYHAKTSGRNRTHLCHEGITCPPDVPDVSDASE
jgi:diguanylate cyclase (GGDEF)-like protein